MDLIRIEIVSKMSYVVPIEKAGLSSKEKKSVELSRGHNFDPIVITLGTSVGLIKT